MSILDDARRLAESKPIDSEWENCVFCAEFPHASDCAWPSMTKIVAVLEAAEAVARAYEQETAATGIRLLGSPLLAAVDALDMVLGG